MSYIKHTNFSHCWLSVWKKLKGLLTRRCYYYYHYSGAVVVIAAARVFRCTKIRKILEAGHSKRGCVCAPRGTLLASLCLSVPCGGNGPHVDTLLLFPLDPRGRAFPGLLLPSAGHIWNWQTSPPSAEIKEAPDWGGGFCHFLPDSTPSALSLLCAEGPQDWPGADTFLPGRDRFMWGRAARRNYAQGCFGWLEWDGEKDDRAAWAAVGARGGGRRGRPNTGAATTSSWL